MSTKRYWRLRKLSRPGLQLKLVSSFLGMTSMALLLQFLLLGGRLTSMLGQIPRHGGDLAQEVPGLLLSVLFLSAGIVLPLMLCLGIVMTHRIAGPVYRFEEYLGQIARGERVGPCRIRKGDELQELCRRLNSAVARLRREGGLENDAYLSLEGVDVDSIDPALATSRPSGTRSTEPVATKLAAGRAGKTGQAGVDAPESDEADHSA